MMTASPDGTGPWPPKDFELGSHRAESNREGEHLQLLTSNLPSKNSKCLQPYHYLRSKKKGIEMLPDHKIGRIQF